MARIDRARLFVTAVTLLGVGCGGAPRAAEPDHGSASAQIIDGEARCGVGTSDEEEAASTTPATAR